MTTNMIRESAKIYEFPIKNPQRLRELRERERLASTYVIESGCGSWYHEQAIREADEARKQ